MTGKPCVNSCKKDHKSKDCKAITKDEDCNKTISEKRLCFNCTRVKYRAAECRSKRICQTCKGKCHSSLCKQLSTMMVATEGSVIYPVAFVKVDSITCRALLDTGAGSTYACAALIKKLSMQTVIKETKWIEMMMHSTVRKTDVFEIEIEDLSGSF